MLASFNLLIWKREDALEARPGIQLEMYMKGDMMGNMATSWTEQLDNWLMVCCDVIY